MKVYGSCSHVKHSSPESPSSSRGSYFIPSQQLKLSNPILTGINVSSGSKEKRVSWRTGKPCRNARIQRAPDSRESEKFNRNSVYEAQEGTEGWLYGNSHHLTPLLPFPGFVKSPEDQSTKGSPSKLKL